MLQDIAQYFPSRKPFFPDGPIPTNTWNFLCGYSPLFVLTSSTNLTGLQEIQFTAFVSSPLETKLLEGKGHSQSHFLIVYVTLR